MAGTNFPFYDFTLGVSYRLSDFDIESNDIRRVWADSENVEIHKTKGVTKMKGNEVVIDLEADYKILGVTSYLQTVRNFDHHHFMFVYSDGEEGVLCKGDVGFGTYQVIRRGLDPNAKVYFTNFINSLVVSNGVDDPFVYEDGALIETYQTRLMNQRGVPGGVMWPYKGRLMTTYEGTIYFSGAGLPTKWRDDPDEEVSDSGFIANFHSDSGVVYALNEYGRYLAVHRDEGVYLLSGSDPDGDDAYVIWLFGDKGSVSPRGVINFNNVQLFYNEGIFGLRTGTLNQIELSDEQSVNIHDWFVDNVDTDRLNEILVVPYPNKQQVWFYFPVIGEEDLSVAWVFDVKNPKKPAWYKRKATPITCACLHEGNIYTGTSDGKILVEDVGNTLAGEDFYAYWFGAFLPFKEPRPKTATYFSMAFDGNKQNTNVDVLFRYDGVESKEKIVLSGGVSIADWLIYDSGRAGDNWPDDRTPISKVCVPGVFNSIQVGVRGKGEFAFDGFTFYDVEVAGSF